MLPNDAPVIILCGGEGSRIADVSRDAVPKPLIRIGDKPILWHIMKVYEAINTGTGQAPALSEIFRARARAFGCPDLALANDETGGQPLLIQADLTRFHREIGEPGARDVEAGLRDLIR